MEHTTDHFLAGGGATIFTQAWMPASPRAVIVLAHGFGEHSGRYGHVAAAFCAAGYGVATMDHRGHGRSGGPRARISAIGELTADFAIYRDEVAERFDLPQVLLGHSVGGAVVVDHLQGDHPPVTAAVLSAPFLRNAQPVPTALRTIAPLLARLAPGIPTVAIDAAAVSRDPAVVAAYEDDPLVYHGKLPAASAAVMVAMEEALLPAAGAITEPTLILHGSEDRLAAVGGSRDLAGTLGAEVVDLKIYDGLYHEVFNEPEQDRVLADVVAWLDDHV